VSTLAQRQTEVIKKQISFEKADKNNVLYLSNINGAINVEGHAGSKILIEAKKTIIAKTTERLEQGMSEISVEVIDRYDTMIVYMKGPCGDFSNKRSHRNGRYRNQQWHYNWNNCQELYDFVIDYTVKVPYDLNLYLSTINEGDIEVSGVGAALDTHNINGSISLKGIQSRVVAHTINGEVDLDFDKNPTLDSKFYSLNGDIVANFKPGLSADMSFKSFNGEFFTNLNTVKHLPMKMEKTATRNKKGIEYKLDGKSMMRARNGGVYLDFETFNGDVYVKEIN
jgi:DUF4097 and DUF4098 domain-containing protein YvlB